MISEKDMTDLATELRAWVGARDLAPEVVTALFLRIVIRSSIDAGFPNSLVIGALKRGFHMERALEGVR